MTHRFPIKEIARQAGLGTATVDRVLNKRAHVSTQTRMRVETAIDELRMQEQQLAARGRRMFIDVVAEAPRRFTDEIREASARAIGTLSNGVFRPRFLFQETMSDREFSEIFDRIEKRGSHGVCLKARDSSLVRERVDRLERAGIPVVTLVTDLPASQRSTYVGVDNANAGRAAADLITKILGKTKGNVFATRSQSDFLGEAERLRCFRETLTKLAPGLKVVDIAGGAGLSRSTSALFDVKFEQHGIPLAVYSMGGGNAAILDAFPSKVTGQLVFIAHDLDAENRLLLRENKISFVLQHDLDQDMQNVFLAISARHGLAPPMPHQLLSRVQIVGPYNAAG